MTFDLAARLDDDVLRSSFDPVTVRRRAAYWRAGRVLETRVDESEGSISGVVKGSTACGYSTRVLLLDRPTGRTNLSTGAAGRPGERRDYGPAGWSSPEGTRAVTVSGL